MEIKDKDPKYLAAFGVITIFMTILYLYNQRFPTCNSTGSQLLDFLLYNPNMQELHDIFTGFFDILNK